MSHSNEKIMRLIEEINQGIEQLNLYCKDLKSKHMGTSTYKINFPKNVIRTVDKIKLDLPKFLDDVTKSNIAYTLMLVDVYRWICDRTKLALVAREMMLKEVLGKYALIIEAITHKYLDNKQSFNKCIDQLYKRNIIDEQLKKDLLELWELRGNQHIYLLEDKEWNKYNETLINKYVRIFNKFLYATNSIE